MQNLGPHAHRMDPELLIKRRRTTQDYIIQILQRKSYNPSPEVMQKISELARRLEERIYRDSLSQGEDYINMTSTTIEQRLQGITKIINNSQQPHYISPSAVSTMIPTPGMPNFGNKSSTVSQGNTMMSVSAGGMTTHAAVNVGNMIPNANGSVGFNQIGSFNASAGSILNGYQQPPANIVHNSGGSNMLSSMGMMRQSNQMIPTPGLNNQQSISLNSESSSGVVHSSMDSSMVSQQQTKQYVGNHSNHMFHGVGMGGGTRSNIQHKPSPYSFPNGVMNGATGSLIGSNLQHTNGPTAPEGYLCPVPYGVSPKSFQQNLDKQQHQTFVPTSMSQQMLPLVGDGYAMSTSDLSGSANIYGPGSTALLSVNSQNLNPDGNFKSKTNQGMLSHHTSLSSIQQTHLKPQKLDGSQSMNFQTTPSTQEQLIQSQQKMQKFQQQQFQQPNQSNVQLVQHPRYHQHNQQLHQLMSNADNLRQPSIPSNFTGQLLPEVGIECNNEPFLPQANEQFHLSELQKQYQHNTSSGNLSKGAQLLGQVQGPQNFQPLPSHVSQQILQAEEQTADSQNELSCLFVGSQTDVRPQEHWNPQSQQKSQIQENLAFDPNIQEEFLQRIVEKDESHQPVISSDAHAYIARASLPQSNRVSCEPLKPNRERDYFNQKRWLLLLLHSRKCPSPKGQCTEANCIKVQQLWVHIERCESTNCMFPRCSPSKKLINHYSTCKAADCPVCNPVREFVGSARAHNYRPSSSILANKMNGSWKDVKPLGLDKVVNKACSTPSEASDCQQPSSKRMKVEHPSTLVPKTESSLVSVPPANQLEPPQETQFNNYEQVVAGFPCKSEVFEVKMDTPSVYRQFPISGSQLDDMPSQVLPAKTAAEPSPRKESDGYTKKEMHPLEKENSHAKMESNQDATVPPTDPTSISKSGKPKIKGVSLTELFTPEQIREHITSLRQWVGQSKAKAEKNQAMERSMSENSCQLCAVEKLTFEPPPIYCTPCGARIKRNAMYYTVGTGDTRHYFCIPCYNEARGDTIEAEGSTFPKLRLEKKKNDEETEEWWVQCDKCEAWQHQICALFNGRRNDGGQAEYTCPNCYIEEIEKGERKPLPQSAVLGAKDLPRTILSDHIEQRLFRRLKHERQERARHFGKSVDEVPGAESLVVRVVSSVDKKLDVKQRFLEIFQEENYPSEFPYKSKVVLLFQKIEGVEVCLFGMYVQEFGSECQFPNQRRVYLSYLDSVKYFRPEIRTVTGEALRTFVYHEILIGYLDYCKKRGFASCYIWACPPLKGEDYILYCHPEIQKTPKSDKLREWYLSMLRKAAKENIAVGLTNLFDHFFISTGECKAKVTAARLPYFDGDYWPGAAEDMIIQLQQEEDGKKQLKKGKTKLTITKRALKAAGHTDLGCNASKDALLMQKLGETISPMKEDFIMVHLQHACAHCCILMTSGNRWVCNQCKNFQICDKCYEAEQKLDDRDRHPISSRERHDLYPIEISDVVADTKDKDEIVESEFFDTRQAFLSLCQGNHYQYDTLRRAKHSSMMVLYHLHNPTAPAFVTTCNVCYHDIETGQGWRCEVCPDFDVCNSCYQRDRCVDHPHKLTNHPSNADRDAQSQEARQKRVLQLRKMLDLLVHASQCRFPHCQYPNCRRVKGLFRHGIQCKTRASGGCVLCKKMWYVLQLHARACKESECHVPRCKDLKEHLRRLQQQSESRRRAAVMEMMRQRAAELQGTDN
ncbi:histone acetyltransferase HAC1 [Dendrobium catenatum]|uniref:histone acetyltransferase n=1 Tax=Dendrobium catenatum TaxID=906689 RepID=A0A2I0V8Y3_9ASPA|nr:histone acetyltransferase HAC1 [Dendrobium catenatum]XP_020683732.1 histone acetyltransferase HAC1 [Dendrobium catenatum]XP_020683733.1 histone acetyltransferase HAC1 [Dendrobium catenatum]XP_020683734.1 histone acetyltransferase HAC1 [Dendrobium catenatum]XP_028548385.1 histone acetyltransferase HAC1 [Dendrobium catenatum]XP_028548386.1 histone acetyltransferase HAC1 [Dendrobium catenatum]PKU59864.1 Histone acetyltransferase HAC12 [Dendrobium catenatum]